jgi:translation initiation factor IF-1
MEYTGVVKEVLGQSRFRVYFFKQKENLESGLYLICFIKNKLKTKYVNSTKRLKVNDIIKLEYEEDFNKGSIKYKYPNEESERLRKQFNLPYYESEYI